MDLFNDKLGNCGKKLLCSQLMKTPVFTVCNPPLYVSTSDNGSTTFLWYRYFLLHFWVEGNIRPPSSTPPPLKLSNVTGQKNLALQVPLVVRYKTLEKFSKALYGTTEGTCSARFFRPVMDRGEIISNLG